MKDSLNLNLLDVTKIKDDITSELQQLQSIAESAENFPQKVAPVVLEGILDATPEQLITDPLGGITKVVESVKAKIQNIGVPDILAKKLNELGSLYKDASVGELLELVQSESDDGLLDISETIMEVMNAV